MSRGAAPHPATPELRGCSIPRDLAPQCLAGINWDKLSISAGHRDTPGVSVPPRCGSQGLTSGSSTTTTSFVLLSMAASSPSSSSSSSQPGLLQLYTGGAGVGNGVAPVRGLEVLGCAWAPTFDPLHVCLLIAFSGAGFPWEPAGQEALRALVPKHRDLSAALERGVGAKANPPARVRAALQGGASVHGRGQGETWLGDRVPLPARPPGAARGGQSAMRTSRLSHRAQGWGGSGVTTGWGPIPGPQPRSGGCLGTVVRAGGAGAGAFGASWREGEAAATPPQHSHPIPGATHPPPAPVTARTRVPPQRETPISRWVPFPSAHMHTPTHKLIAGALPPPSGSTPGFPQQSLRHQIL